MAAAVLWAVSPVAGLAGDAVGGLPLVQAAAPAQNGGGLAPPFLAQFDEELEQTYVEDVFLSDRETTRRLNVASEALEKGRYADAAELLDRILADQSDQWVKPPEGSSTYRGIKADAQGLLGTLPAEGLQSYELQFGADARRMLSAAIQEGDIDRLAETSQRFFHTRAGGEATILLAQHHLDHGQPVAAAVCLERLRAAPAVAEPFEPMLSVSLAACWARANRPERATRALVELKKRLPQATLRIAGHDVQLFRDDAKALEWLRSNVAIDSRAVAPTVEDWAMFGGDAARNVSSRGGRPLMSPRWRVEAAIDPAERKQFSDLQRRLEESEQPALSPLHPLAVSGVVLMRTHRNLLAVDLRTGKRLWEPATSPAQQQGSRPVFGDPGLFARPSMSPPENEWKANVESMMSSDGKCVFLIDDAPPASSWSEPPAVRILGGRRPVAGGSNTLVALELNSEGKRKWEVGGDASVRSPAPELAEVVFLGPPLPLDGRLYVLAEQKGEIRLLVLSAETGKLEWSQTLAQTEQSSVWAGGRSGITPSFAEGVLVCPTLAGAIVAVDLGSRSLLWGYQYPADAAAPQGASLRIRRRLVERALSQDQSWADSSATIADGRVVITPAESKQAFCFDLLEGKLLWRRPQGEDLYVACAHDGKAIFVGRRYVEAVNLTDGKPVWLKSQAAVSDEAMPSGRGFLSGDYYYLPLKTAEIAQIDLRTGKFETTAKSRSGSIPGNLICYGDQIISQSFDGTEAFYQLEPRKAQVAKALDTNPDDAQALAGRGAISLDQGNLPQAIADLRRSFQLNPDVATRDLLIESLLQALATDFPKHRDSIPEIKQLIELGSQRRMLLIVAAGGFARAGEHAAAFNSLAELYDLPWNPENLELIEPTLAVRPDRWVQARWVELWKAARPDEQASMAAAITTRLDAALGQSEAGHDGGVTALRKFIAYFGNHASADEARDRLASQLQGSDTMLEREQLLRVLAKSADRARTGSAVARLAALMTEANRPEEAAEHYRRLSAEFADQAVLGGKTGSQLVAALPPEAAVRKWLKPQPQWPIGEVKVSRVSATSPTLSYQRSSEVALPDLRESAVPQLAVTHGPQNVIVGQDRHGKQRWQIPLGQATPNFYASNYGAMQPVNLNRGNVNGHLLIVSVGQQLYALDTLRSAETSGEKLLWQQSLLASPGAGDPSDPFGSSNMQVQTVQTPWGQPRHHVTTQQGAPVGQMGPLIRGAVYTQFARDLMCIDALTGARLWTRQNLPPGCELFGDEELLLAIPPGLESNQAFVLRPTDGELLGERAVPGASQRWATVGRFILAWTAIDGKMRLGLFDPAQGKDQWTLDFAPGTKGFLLGTAAAAVMEPGGRFVLLSLPDGAKKIDDALDAVESLLGIYVQEDSDRYLVFTSSHPESTQKQVRIRTVFGEQANPIVSGKAYAFDRETGKRAWAAPASLQQQGLLLEQPADLPCAVFVRHVQESRSGASRASLLAIDKRNGRVVLEADSVPNVSNLEIVSDPEKRTVTLMLPMLTLTLTYTDIPVPPEPPAQFDGDAREQAEALRRASKAGAVVRALFRAGRDLQGSRETEEPFEDND